MKTFQEKKNSGNGDFERLEIQYKFVEHYLDNCYDNDDDNDNGFHNNDYDTDDDDDDDFDCLESLLARTTPVLI